MRIQITLLISIFLLFSTSCSAQKTSAENINKIATLEKPRAVHTATRLLDGNVLVVGGMYKNAVFHDGAEVFNPKQNTFTTLKNKLTKKRVAHTATLLKDGRILIVGGWSNREHPEKSAEVYNPKTQKFSAVRDMRFMRSGHSSTLLDNGKVLIAGGYNGDRIFDEAELFNPETNSFEFIGKMKTPRKLHTATKLKDGKILFVGGEVRRRETTSSAEIFDPKTNKFIKLSATMRDVRYKHDAILLLDGKVLIFGGSDHRDGRGKLKTAEIFDPKKQTFIPTNNMKFARFKIGEAATLLNNGKVLIAGGSEEAEIFNPKTKSFERVSGIIGKSFHFASVTLLKDGRALILGGYEFIKGGEPTSTNQAWIFKI